MKNLMLGTDTCAGQNLDTWGQIVGVQRGAGESDDSYRAVILSHYKPRVFTIKMAFSFSKHYEFDKGNQRRQAILAQRAKK